MAGLAEATDAVVTTPLGQLETWQSGSAELPPVMTTLIRGVPVRTQPRISIGQCDIASPLCAEEM